MALRLHIPLGEAISLLLLAWPCAGWAQPQPPELVGDCVRRFGHTGCAARLYAQLLCDSFDQPALLLAQQQRLSEAFEREGVSFAGILPEEVETAAVRYYTPMLCPERSPQIRALFQR